MMTTTLTWRGTSLCSQREEEEEELRRERGTREERRRRKGLMEMEKKKRKNQMMVMKRRRLRERMKTMGTVRPQRRRRRRMKTQRLLVAAVSSRPETTLKKVSFSPRLEQTSLCSPSVSCLIDVSLCPLTVPELSNMSFEDIMKLQSKVGTKVYNEVAYGSAKKRETGKKKRLNKNRPMEISAKKPAPFLRQVVPIKKPTLRDPRFDDLSGEYKPEIFDKTYKFINDIKQREKEVIQKQLKRTKKSNQRKEKLQFLLKRMVSLYTAGFIHSSCSVSDQTRS
uniref:rRNA biogenesis protein RRP36 n=1 Tax=Lates calcarifer TaxID=8187 RepID=A0A4W6DX39_LATCA